MILLVTGSRYWSDKGRITRELQAAAQYTQMMRLPHLFAPLELRYVVLGDNPKGVDKYAREACLELGLHAVVCIANWPTRGKPAGHERNGRMVEVATALAQPGEARVCLAFPLGRSSGTRDCMRRCKAAGFKMEEREP